MDKRRDDSQKSWQASQTPPPVHTSEYKAPAPTYATPNGVPKTVDTSHTTYLKGRLDEARLQQRPRRYDDFFGTRYSSRPRVYYDDGYDSRFWWWMRDQNYHTQAQYAYNHRYDMDQRRYNDLLLISGIATEISYLEMQNTPRVTTWAPAGMDYDLMYGDAYVNNVVHYGGAPAVAPVVVSRGGHTVAIVVMVMLVLVALLVVVVVVCREGE